MQVGHSSSLTARAEVGGNVTFTCSKKYPHTTNCTEDCSRNDTKIWHIHSLGKETSLIRVDSPKFGSIKEHLHLKYTSEWSSEYNRTEFSLIFTNLSMEENNTLVSCQVETIECGVVNPIQPFLLIVTEPTPDEGNSTDTTLTGNTDTPTSNTPILISTTSAPIVTDKIVENCTTKPITTPTFTSIIFIPIAVVEFVVIVLLAFCLLRLKGRCTLEITGKQRLSLNNVESQTVIAGIAGILKNISKTEDNPKSEMKKESEVIVNEGAEEDRPSKNAKNSNQTIEGESEDLCQGKSDDSCQGKSEDSCQEESEDSRQGESEDSRQGESKDSCQAIKVICSDRPSTATETEMESGNLVSSDK